jgi:cysteine desulfurase
MPVYLDWAATTPPDADILAEAALVAAAAYANPSSVHAAGKEAAARLAEARSRCAAALGVKAETLVFTSGGTESDHLPLLALLQRPVRGSVAVSAVEHPAILEQAKSLEQTGWKTRIIPVTREGFVTPEAVLRTIAEDTAYVAVMAVNNETGAIQPVAEIADALARACVGRKKPHFHVDAVQAVGKIPLDLSAPGIDSAAMSAHKIRGPRGIGLLYLARRIEPFIRGGGQESGMRPGTENLAGAWALSRALEKCCAGGIPREISATEIDAQGLSARDSSIRDMSDRLIDALSRIQGVSILPETRAAGDPRFSPYVMQFTNTVLPGEVLVRALSDRGVYISTGSACSSRKKSRPVLDAMRVSPDRQQNAFRISIGPSTVPDDIDALGAALAATLKGL